jgi:hypothetical protein
MRFPLSLLALAGQVPLQDRFSPSTNTSTMRTKAFALKEGEAVFSPKDLIELTRPGEGVSNDAGDLVLVALSKYSLEHKK